MALNMLYPIECPDHGSEIEDSVDAPIEETQDGNNSDDIMEDVDNSTEIKGNAAQLESANKRPTRCSVVAVREKIMNRLNPMKDTYDGVGNVADQDR